MIVPHRDASRSALNPPQAEIRQAVALLCADALACNVPLSTTQQRAIELALRRLVQAEPITVQEEGAIVSSLLRVGCNLCPPYDQTVFGPVSCLAGKALI